MAKSTYGTGCFLLLNTGDTPVLSQNRLLTTPAYRIGGRTTYALEGSHLRRRRGRQVAARRARPDRRRGARPSALAAQVPDSHGVYLVPAFVGLGAPHWVPDARALICGLTLDATGAHLARAALESVAYQTLDLLTAMTADGARRAAVDHASTAAWPSTTGSASSSPMRSTRTVERPAQVETTALGAAFLAGLATGVWPDLKAVAGVCATGATFMPAMSAARRAALVAGWKMALRRTLVT